MIPVWVFLVSMFVAGVVCWWVGATYGVNRAKGLVYRHYQEAGNLRYHGWQGTQHALKLVLCEMEGRRS